MIKIGTKLGFKDCPEHYTVIGMEDDFLIVVNSLTGYKFHISNTDGMEEIP